MELKLVNLNNTELKNEILKKELEVRNETGKIKRSRKQKELNRLLEKYLTYTDGGFNLTYLMIIGDYWRQGKTTEQFFQWVEARERKDRYINNEMEY